MKLVTLFIIMISLNSIYSAESNEEIIMNCYINESNVITTKISDKRDEDALASAVYKKSYEKIGWDYLSIATYEKNDKKYNDSSKAYAMGFLEGTLTNERIYSHYKNFHNYFLKFRFSNTRIFERKIY